MLRNIDWNVGDQMRPQRRYFLAVEELESRNLLAVSGIWSSYGLDTFYTTPGARADFHQQLEETGGVFNYKATASVTATAPVTEHPGYAFANAPGDQFDGGWGDLVLTVDGPGVVSVDAEITVAAEATEGPIPDDYFTGPFGTAYVSLGLSNGATSGLIYAAQGSYGRPHLSYENNRPGSSRKVQLGMLIFPGASLPYRTAVIHLVMGASAGAEWSSGGSSEASLTVEYTARFIPAPPVLPDLATTTLAWDSTQGGGVDFGYEISRKDLQKSTSAGLCWSDDGNFDSADTPAYQTPIQSQVGSHGPVFVSGADLATAPIGTKYLLLVVDPDNVINEADETNNVRALAVPTSEQIVQGAVQPYIGDLQTDAGAVISGVVMNATFTPNYGFTLDTAAHLSGFDHFNWMQLVTNDPHPPLANSGKYPSVSYMDPPAGGYKYLPADSRPYYWNEEPGFNPIYDLIYNERPKPKPTALSFEDIPSDTFAKFEFLGFTTFLVGVYADATKWHEFSEFGTSFTWRSNFNGRATNPSGGVYDVVTRYFGLDHVTSGTGGIFDLVPNFDIETLPRSVRELMAASGGQNVSLAGPLLDPVPNINTDEGSNVALSVTASDSDPNRMVTFSLGAGPPGAEIDPDTGLFTWTPTDGFFSGEVTVRVTDNGVPALSDTQSFTITVNNVAPTATFANSGPVVLYWFSLNWKIARFELAGKGCRPLKRSRDCTGA